MNLNESALERCQRLLDAPARYRVSVVCSESGARVVDCGVLARGGLDAGRILAEVCLAGRAEIDFQYYSTPGYSGPGVSIRTDWPVAACMASQYAGWQIAGQKYFAMGSGPMRAIRRREPLFEEIKYPPEKNHHAVGVLESGKLPPAEVCQHIATECGIEAECVTLLVAKTASLAGTVQIVARSLETALHKMHTLKFDLSRIVSGSGIAPLPPVAANDMAAIGRTNDAVLYGGDVTIWVTGDDSQLREIGPLIPSESSRDYGAPFSDILRYQFDFYKIDPLLFSPARVTLINIDTGNSFCYGQIAADILATSFGTLKADI